MKGILLIRGGAIGDFICTLPVVAALRRQLPETPISLLAYDRVLPLAAATGDFAAVRSLESRAFAGFFGRGAPLDEEWVRYFGSFGMIFSFLYDPDGILTANLNRCKVKSVFAIDPRPIDRHATEHLCSILPGAGFFANDFSPRIRLKQDQPAGEFAGHVVLHPGSGSQKKNWDLANWAGLVEFLLERDLPVAVVAGEADLGRLDALTRNVVNDRLQIIRQKPLLEVANLLRAARLFVGHDSGISHLAASVGTPTLALFGPSHPHLWAPRSGVARILWKNKPWSPDQSSALEIREFSVDDNSLELVKAQITEMLAGSG